MAKTALFKMHIGYYPDKNLIFMAIKLRYRKLTGGYVVPYFDIIYGKQRKTETLTLLKYKERPASDKAKEDAKRKKEQIQILLREAELKVIRGEYDFEENKSKYVGMTDFFDYLDKYIDTYPNSGDLRTYKAVKKKLEGFVGKSKLYVSEIDEAFLTRFAKMLDNTLNGETPSTYFKRLKTVLKKATEENLFKVNPAQNVKTSKATNKIKDVLTVEEIEALRKTRCPNINVKRAFLFACYTGLRFVDVKNLTWKNVGTNEIKLLQCKTKQLVEIPVMEDSMQLLGMRGNDDEKVFILPSHTACLKSIRKWVENAGINKKITFHCARHSVGTNLVALGVNISTVSRILGHASLKHTMKYVRTGEDLKRVAIQALSNATKL